MADRRRNILTSPGRVPPSVRLWYRIHTNEGVHPDLAVRRAVERAFCAGEISEAAADRLEQALNAGELDPAIASN